MKLTRTNRWISRILVCTLFFTQTTPIWANSGSSGGGSGGSTGGGGGGGGNSNGSTNDPIDTQTGDNYFTEVDLLFPAPGVPVVFKRRYNSTESCNSPFGSGWSHSMDWRLHESRQIITTLEPSITNKNYKLTFWEGTSVLSGQQLSDDPPFRTNLLTIVSELLFGSPVKNPVETVVKQPGNNYSIDLDQPYISGQIGASTPVLISSLEDMAENPLITEGVSYRTNRWMEVYEGDGTSTRFRNTETNGIYWADDKNWSLSSNDDIWTLHLPGGEERVFNASGRMIRHQDGWGKGISFTYNDVGQLIRAEHDSGLALQFSYTNGHITSLSVGSGASLTYDYTSDGLLDIVTQQYGSRQRIRRFEYTDGILTQRINPEGHEYYYGYEVDAAENLTAKATALSIEEEGWYRHEVQYLSQTLTDVLYTTRGLQQWHRYAYSSKNEELTHHFGPGIDPVDAETRGIRYDYNAADDEIEETLFDENMGNSFSIFKEYDTYHNPTHISVAYNSTNRTPLSTTTWDDTCMRPVSIANADGETLTLTYINGSLTKLRNAKGDDILYGYTPDGLLTSVTNANGNLTQYTCDSRGYPKTHIPAVGPQTETTYDSYGHLQALEILPEGSSNSTGRITHYQYNPLGWLESVAYPDGLSISNSYNRLGDLTQTVDRADRVTDYTYTPESRLASKTQTLEENGTHIPVRIAYDYDQQFNTLRITEPRGRYVETYLLDIQDRLTTVTNIEGQVLNIDYALGDRVSDLTRFDGSRIATTYDSTGRKATVSYFSPDNQQQTTINQSYYPDSQLQTLTDGATTISNTYDRLNRISTVESLCASVSSVVNYSHDSVGNLTHSVVALNNPATNNLTTSYTYDKAERLTEISQTVDAVSPPRSFSYSYSPINGRVSSITNSESGIVTSYEYDILDRVTNLTYKTSAGATIRSLDYAHDANSMITNLVTSDDSSQLSVKSYQYDSINRLIREDSGDSWAKYTYDLAGNRTQTVDATPSSHSTNTYTLGTGNRLNHVDATPSSRSVSFDYNNAGCTTSISNDTHQLALDWNEKYQLSSVTSATSAVQYSYDVLGRRISRTEISNSQPQTTNSLHYIYSGNQIVADLDETGNLLRTYTWGPGIDNLLALTIHPQTTNSNPQTYYPLKDHQNTLFAFVDETGSTVESYEYDAWGNVLGIYGPDNQQLDNSQLGNRYLFQGREYDSQTGLYYFRARWYSPEAGRWLSKDPIGISGGLNLYAFCDNNPVNFVDPMGYYGLAGAAVGGISGGISGAISGYASGGWAGAAAGAVTGAAVGAAVGAVNPLAGGAAGGAVGGAVGSAIGQLSQTGSVNGGAVAGAALSGAAGGALGGLTGGGLVGPAAAIGTAAGNIVGSAATSLLSNAGANIANANTGGGKK